MSHARLKRRLMAWERYRAATGTRSAGYGYHEAHLRAYTGVAYTGRAAPHGIRAPWILRPHRPFISSPVIPDPWPANLEAFTAGQQTINVVDHGADRTGATDSTGAVNAAIGSIT